MSKQLSIQVLSDGILTRDLNRNFKSTQGSLVISLYEISYVQTENKQEELLDSFTYEDDGLNNYFWIRPEFPKAFQIEIPSDHKEYKKKTQKERVYWRFELSRKYFYQKENESKMELIGKTILTCKDMLEYVNKCTKEKLSRNNNNSFYGYIYLFIEELNNPNSKMNKQLISNENENEKEKEQEEEEEEENEKEIEKKKEEEKIKEMDKNSLTKNPKCLNLNFKIQNLPKMKTFGKADPYLVVYREFDTTPMDETEMNFVFGDDKKYNEGYQSFLKKPKKLKEFYKNRKPGRQWYPRDFKWLMVAISDVQKKVLNSKFNLQLPYAHLNGKNLNQNLRIECWDWNKNGIHDFIGSCELTLNDLVAKLENTNNDNEYPLINLEHKLKKKKYTNSGTISVFEISEDY
ncbi:copine domain protein atypical [Anaeramoeba flamelloides]|uniref:Copine domain protein atypical n=1 Tax=Anaeramoeba flamelloides TaxID=1746091 RepID=A0AAV7YDX3_9EUKA|nr:copine domain protein atypical [Anaeramoeba flamelloides]